MNQYPKIESKEDFREKINAIYSQLEDNDKNLYAALREACARRKLEYEDTLKDGKSDKKAKAFMKNAYDVAYNKVVDFERKVGIHKLGMAFYRTMAMRFKGKAMPA